MNKNTMRFVATLLCAGLAVIVNYAISLALTPYITQTLGTDAYGFVSLAKSFSQYAIIFTAALNSYAARFISVAHHSGEEKAEKRYFSTVFWANMMLGLIVILVAVILVANLERLIRIPEHLINDVKLLFLLNFVNYMVVATGTCFTAYGHVRNKLAVVNGVKIIAYTLEAGALIVFFRFCQPRVYYVGIALLISAAANFVLNQYICRRELPALTLSPKCFSWKAVKDLVFSGVWNSLNSMGNILNTGLDLLVTNLMLSATAVGQLSIVKTVATIFSTLYQTVSTPLQPILLKNYASGNKTALVRTFKIGVKFTAFFSGMLFAGLVAYGKVYYRLWVPDQDATLLYQLTVITLLGLLLEGPAYPLFYIYTLTLKNRIPCFVTIGSGLLNVAGKYFLLKYTELGIYSIVLTTTVLAWAVYFVFTPLYTAYCLKIKWTSFYPVIFRVLFAGSVCTAICMIAAKIFFPSSWIGLIISAFVCVAVCIPVYLILVVSKDEMKALCSFVKRRQT